MIPTKFDTAFDAIPNATPQQYADALRWLLVASEVAA